ncbi:Uncharacterised protein [Escherichia coli]|uniref:Uncharacterized protein n=1 Tax=Escherichia coli TaxID=562 RepID=A0A376U787_ECOLX|nr:Uncharacterised protein [Escherichia coli]
MYTLNWQPPYDWSWMWDFSPPVHGVVWKRSLRIIMPVVWRWANIAAW